MPKKLLVVFAVLLVVGAAVLGGGGVLAASSPAPTSSVATLPQPITSESPCPATGCASGSCHGFDNVPSPDGVHEMVCPEVGCASVECHAWDTLRGRYHQASDASLNLWILMPVALVMALALVVKKMR